MLRGLEPPFDRRNLLVRELVTTRLQFEGHFGATACQQLGQPLRLAHRYQGIAPAAGEQDRDAGEIRILFEVKGDHGMQEDGLGNRFGPHEQHARRYVRSVRVSEGNDRAPFQVVVLRGALDEVGELECPALEIILVEHSHCDAAKEARHAVFQDLPPRAQQVSLWGHLAPEGKEIILVAAGAMEQQQCHPCAAALEAVRKAEIVGQEAVDLLTNRADNNPSAI